MNRKHFLLFSLLSGLFSGNAHSQNDYFVGFFGEGISLSAPVGHAFIGIGKGIPLTCNINGDETEMVGFYPRVRIEGGKSLWFGPVDGNIKNDVRAKIDDYVFKKITFADYLRVKLKIEDWKEKRYELTRNDCISFFIDVAGLFPDTVLPDRTQFVTPEKYVARFILINNILR